MLCVVLPPGSQVVFELNKLMKDTLFINLSLLVFILCFSLYFLFCVLIFHDLVSLTKKHELLLLYT